MLRIKNNRQLFQNREQGMTLTEVIVTFVIVSILAAVAVPSYIQYKKKAQVAEAYMNLSKVGDACLTKVIRAKSMGQSSVTTPPMPTGQYFNYSGNCTLNTSLFTATGTSGMVSGGTLTLSINANSGNITKTWGGTLN